MPEGTFIGRYDLEMTFGNDYNGKINVEDSICSWIMFDFPILCTELERTIA